MLKWVIKERIGMGGGRFWEKEEKWRVEGENASGSLENVFQKRVTIVT